MVALFNDILKEEVAAAKLGYIDLYGTLVTATGSSEEGAHIDRIHLSPLAYKKAIEASTSF